MKNEIIKKRFWFVAIPKNKKQKNKKRKQNKQEKTETKKKETKYPHNNQIITATYLEYYDVVD